MKKSSGSSGFMYFKPIGSFTDCELMLGSFKLRLRIALIKNLMLKCFEAEGLGLLNHETSMKNPEEFLRKREGASVAICFREPGKRTVNIDFFTIAQFIPTPY